jgi:DNA modification methylase
MDVAIQKCSGKQYGVALAPGRNYGHSDWDGFIPDRSTFELMFATSMEQVIFGGNYFTDFLPPVPSWIIWDKATDDKFSNDFGDCELAWCSNKKPARMIRYLWRGMLHGNMKEKEIREHPTQKPLPVLKRILDMFPDAKSILDPFMGSGTTLRAAKDLQRKAIGIEIEEKYCEISARRMSQEVLAF